MVDVAGNMLWEGLEPSVLAGKLSWSTAKCVRRSATTAEKSPLAGFPPALDRQSAAQVSLPFKVVLAGIKPPLAGAHTASSSGRMDSPCGNGHNPRRFASTGIKLAGIPDTGTGLRELPLLSEPAIKIKPDSPPRWIGTARLLENAGLKELP